MTYQELVDKSVAKMGHPRKYGKDKIKGYNQHHIVPRCMGGSDDGDNIVYLTYAEHLMAHILLFRENPNNYGLAKTATFMADKCDDIRDYLVTIVDNEDEFNDYIVDLVKAREVANEEHSKHISGKNNPFYGKHHTEESRQKMRENRPDMSGENNPMCGKHHTEESKQKIRENIPDKFGENNPFYGKHHTKETIQKIKDNMPDMSGENNPCWGRKRTEEEIQKWRDSMPDMSGENHPMWGKHHTEESKQKMRENRPDVSGENNPTSKSVRCKETGQVFATCRMASKWAKCSPGNITHALKTGGKAKGYHWEYITREEYLAIENE